MAGGGYYADPMSPIASTPMKRQRIKKPQNTKSVKAKHPPLPSTRKTPGSSCIDGSSSSEGRNASDEVYFSPRKLVNEYDVDDDTSGSANATKENCDVANGKVATSSSDRPMRGRTRSHEEACGSEEPQLEQHDDGNQDSLFSPAFKIPRTSRSPSRTRSTSRERTVGSRDKDQNQSLTPSSEDLNGCSEELSLADESYLSSSTLSEPESTSSADAITEFNPFLFMKALPKYDDIVPETRPIVLPERTPHTPKICLVLDLDETLVHCSVDKLDNPSLEFPVTFNGAEYVVYVKKRPHMDLFLQKVSKLFEVVVFTASQRVYAEKLLNLLDPQRELIKYRLYREDCLFVDGNLLKDLNVLGRHLSKVLLVDNSPHAFGYQVNNGIPIESWFQDDDDNELLNLLPLLESLANVDDVRPHIARQFQIQKLIDHAEFASVF